MWSFRPRIPRPRVIAAIVRRDFLDTRSYHVALLLDVFFGVLELATYFFISRTFGNLAPSDIGDAPTYFAFAAVGIVIASVITGATAGIGDRLRREQLSGTLEALLTHPLTAIELCFGVTGFPYLYALSRSIIYLTVAGTLMDLDLSNANWLGFGAVFIASGLALSALGILAGAVVILIKRGDVLVGTIIFGLTLVSGSVFPVSALPGWLEAIGQLSPLKLAFDGARSALFGGNDWFNDVALLVAFAAAIMPLALLAFSLSLSYVKRAGSIAQY